MLVSFCLPTATKLNDLMFRAFRARGQMCNKPLCQAKERLLAPICFLIPILGIRDLKRPILTSNTYGILSYT